jgi:hypothetical protein
VLATATFDAGAGDGPEAFDSDLQGAERRVGLAFWFPQVAEKFPH